MPAEPLYFFEKTGCYCCQRMGQDLVFRWGKGLILHNYGMKTGFAFQADCDFELEKW
jgi:hypothetical protein